MSQAEWGCDLFVMNTDLEAKQLTYQFDSFRVDIAGFRLFNASEIVELEPKALQLLIFLIENRGRLLEKQELLNAVWGKLSVTENALTREIALLRRALGDDTRQPRFIETVPTRGYRFVGKVTEVSGPVEPPALTPVSTSRDHSSQALIPGKLLLFFVLVVVAALLVASAIRYGINSSGGFLGRAPMRLAQITFSSGLDVFPSFSPDGNSIAYASDHSGKFEIYVRQLSLSGGEVQITSDGGVNLEPAYSPDGQSIAYHSKSKNGIWIVPALGGVPKRITDFGSRPAWSHDGSRIAFESGDIGAMIETEAGSSPDSSIWTVNVSDGTLRQITHNSDTPTPSMFGHSSPQWSPDDRRILFAASGWLWTVGSDGQDLQQVAPGVFGYDPVFSYDGKRVLFVGGVTSESGIWEIPVNDRVLATGKPVRVHSLAPGTGHYLALSRSGKRIAFVSMDTKDNLYSISSSSKGDREPLAVTQDTRLRKTNPSLSFDGKHVAFAVAQVGRPSQIWIASTDGKEAQQLPIDKGAGNPSWLADNTLCYWTFNDGKGQLWNWNIEQGRAREVFQSGPAHMGFTRLSPDGKRAVFQRTDAGAINVWTISFADGHTRQLTFERNMAGWPAWSRSTKLLAVEVRDGPSTNIAIMSADGGPLVPVTHNSGQNWPYSWSPDDDQIAFAGYRNGAWNVYSVSRATGAERQLTNYARPNTFVRYPEWSPNGDQIVYEYGESTGNIWMLESR